MKTKLYDSELRVMEILWSDGDCSAKDIAAALKEQVGWSKTTTYTVIKKCVDKGAVKRTDPGFMCSAIISNEQVREYETDELINKMYNGSADMLVAALLDGDRLSDEKLRALRDMVEKSK